MGVAYSGQRSAAGGTPPYTFSGSGLPAGISLSNTGAVTGTPTAAGDFILSATVTDSTAGTVPHTASEALPVHDRAGRGDPDCDYRFAAERNRQRSV